MIARIQAISDPRERLTALAAGASAIGGDSAGGAWRR
jgi:hypothetical protein